MNDAAALLHWYEAALAAVRGRTAVATALSGEAPPADRVLALGKAAEAMLQGAANLCCRAEIQILFISDVPGDDPAAVGSGPFGAPVRLPSEPGHGGRAQHLAALLFLFWMARGSRTDIRTPARASVTGCASPCVGPTRHPSELTSASLFAGGTAEPM